MDPTSCSFELKDSGHLRSGCVGREGLGASPAGLTLATVRGYHCRELAAACPSSVVCSLHSFMDVEVRFLGLHLVFHSLICPIRHSWPLG